MAAAFWGFGLLATLLPFGFSRTYTLVTFPMVYLSLPAIIQGWSGGYRNRERGFLAGICVCQLVLSATFLWYVHVNHGMPMGLYGPTYGAQQSGISEPLNVPDE